MVPAKEDSWAFVPIGAPFPEFVVRANGCQNQYPALWYKFGVPVFGRAWNNNGVVQCSFPYLKTELTGARDLGGQIQILQFKGSHLTEGYWYNWVKYSNRFGEGNDDMVHCGDSLPILWNRPTGPIVGSLNNKTEVARFSEKGVSVEVSGGALKDFLIITREKKKIQPGCTCPTCGAAPPVLTKRNLWADYRVGDAWPSAHGTPLKALGKSLNTAPGESPDQYVALYYVQGSPVYGRIWDDGGKIAGVFNFEGKVFTKNLGSIQILMQLPDNLCGYTYDWRSYSEAASFDTNKEWHPVYVRNAKGSISPAVLSLDGGKQILGKSDLVNEKNGTGIGGVEYTQTAKQATTCLVLCRKKKAGYELEDDF
uniref:DUF3421 domain-containing protein n=1 Tax=Rhabditophanes sp. KR3021 TaxID=114890 RepID=A0AC35TGQ4_9BILA